MSDFIIFTIAQSDYALEVASIERIDQIPKLTPIPNAHPFIEGLITYQDHTLKVVSFRKMTSVVSHEEQMLTFFNQVIAGHHNWVNALEVSLRDGIPFTLALDPRLCQLGKWIYSYQAHDPEVLAIIRALIPVHARLHETGAELLQLNAVNHEETMQRYTKEIVNGIYMDTMRLLGEMVRKSAEISMHSQKLLIYRAQQGGDEGMFALKVDAIKDIVSIDDSMIKSYSHQVKVGACLHTRGVVEYKKSLVVVIDTVSLPNEEESA